jgi:hypothetical protein
MADTAMVNSAVEATVEIFESILRTKLPPYYASVDQIPLCLKLRQDVTMAQFVVKPKNLLFKPSQL